MTRACRLRRALPAAAISFLCSAQPAWAQPPALRSDVFVSGLSAPVAFVQDPSNANVQYIVEQAGHIRVVNNGTLTSTDFLNVASQISCCGERGLLGLAFPPDYGASGRFYVYFTNPAGHIVIARFKRSASPLVADPSTRLDFLWPGGNRFIPHPTNANHNGGTLAFGGDGYLYAGVGDGGSGNDPPNNAQTPSTLLGKMLRLNVNVPDSDVEGYDIPPDNPFVDGMPVAALQQIWAFGLRNPFKFSFDNPARGGTGALVIGDVGQNDWEEIDYEPPGQGGRNYGWRYREGAHNNVTTEPPAYQPLVDPVFEYSHTTGATTGAAIIGGYVYRGTQLGLSYAGRYFFADLIGRVWSIALTINGVTGEATASGLIEHTSQLGLGSPPEISSWGEDANGELYIVSWNQGTVHRISGACSYTINPTSTAYDATGGGGMAAVTAPVGCAWSAASNDAFLNITGGASGSGNGVVTYTVAANTGGANVANPGRTGTLTIAGRSLTVSQTGCSYTIAPSGTTFGSGGGSSAVNVTTPTACSWTVTGVPVWATTTSGDSGTGPDAWRYSVAANAGATRAQPVSIAGQTFQLRQLSTELTSLVPGQRTAFTLANAADERWASSEVVAGRSYCAELAADPTAVNRATPSLVAFRADGTTSLGSGTATRACFVAPAIETALFKVTQADLSPRPYRVAVVETTLWANWFFIGGNYSSYTLLRNTTGGPITTTIVWRSDAGVVVGSETITIPPGGVAYRDARSTTAGAVAGSVEVGHNGESQALVGSQTTLSPLTGLAFDTILMQRVPR